MQKTLPFLSDTTIPAMDKGTAFFNEHGYVYPMEQYPTPMPMSVGAMVIPPNPASVVRQYMLGHATIQLYPTRVTGKRVFDALTVCDGICVVSMKGYLWLCLESDAREMGAKPYSEWVDLVKKSEIKTEPVPDYAEVGVV